MKFKQYKYYQIDEKSGRMTSNRSKKTKVEYVLVILSRINLTMCLTMNMSKCVNVCKLTLLWRIFRYSFLISKLNKQKECFYRLEAKLKFGIASKLTLIITLWRDCKAIFNGCRIFSPDSILYKQYFRCHLDTWISLIAQSSRGE
jgi:hypothetical protein